MLRTPSIWCVALFAAGLLSCGPPTGPTWNESYEVTGPVEAGNELIYLNRTLEQVRILEPARSNGTLELRIDKRPTGNEPSKMALSPNEDRLFVLNRGDESLSVYDLDDSDPEPATVRLESSYDRITVGPRGEFVLLSFSENPSGCISCNPQEVGIVDLRNGVPNNAQFESLPRRVVDFEFAPTFKRRQNDQRLVAALAPSRVLLLDLNVLTSEGGAEVNEVRSVSLTKSDAAPPRTPKDAVFHVEPGGGDNETVALYVSTREESDVTQITIQPNQRSGTDRKFNLSINQLASGSSPSALTVLGLDDDETRLLALNSRRASFRLVDVESGEGSSYDLPMTGAPDDMLVYETVVSTDQGDRAETRVLAWSQDSAVVAVIRPASIAVSGESPTAGRSVRAIRLEAAPSTIRMERSTDRKRAVAVHRGAGAGFSLLDLRAGQNEANFIQGNSLADIEFAGTTAWGVFRGTAHFGRFDLESGHPTVFELPSRGERLVHDGPDSLILVDHGVDHGKFTLLDANEPGPENARLFEGVFLQGLFEEDVSGSN